MQIQVIKRTAAPQHQKVRVCAYARVSTDSSEQEDSLENQITYYADYIQANPGWELAGIYADQGISGFYEKRPQFQRMIADARAGKIDLIVVKSVSRFARNTETVLKFSRELKSIGVGIFFQLQNINTLSGTGELMLAILAAFAQAESEGAAANAKLTYRRKFDAGKRVSGLERTLGYREDENGNIVIVEEEAQTVRLIFDLAQNGVWPSKIKGYLKKQGIKNPTGAEWSDSRIFRILDNAAYKGDLMMQKTYQDERRRRHKNRGQHEYWYLPDNHPAIVSEEQWDTVQNVLQQRSNALQAYQSAHPEGRVSSRTTYPLSGKLFCPYCGKVLIHKWCTSPKNGPREYWGCRTKLKEGAKYCKGIYLPAQVANEWGDITEPVTAFFYEDEYGMPHYTAYPKDEYEQSTECPYTRKED
jgi:DNA invertase Pin-like site-specific DNA recombinase